MKWKPKQQVDINSIKKLLSKYKKDQIFITPNHAAIRVLQRNLSEREIINDLLQPSKLTYAETGDKTNRYKLFFEYGTHRHNIYITKLTESKLLVISVWKRNRRLREKVMKNAKKIRI